MKSLPQELETLDRLIEVHNAQEDIITINICNVKLEYLKRLHGTLIYRIFIYFVKHQTYWYFSISMSHPMDLEIHQILLLTVKTVSVTRNSLMPQYPQQTDPSIKFPMQFASLKWMMEFYGNTQIHSQIKNAL